MKLKHSPIYWSKSIASYFQHYHNRLYLTFLFFQEVRFDSLLDELTTEIQ